MKKTEFEASKYLKLLIIALFFYVILVSITLNLDFNKDKKQHKKHHSVKNEMVLNGEYTKFDVVKDLKFDRTGKTDNSEKLIKVINENKYNNLILYFPEGNYKIEPKEFKIKDIKKIYMKGENKKVNINLNSKVLEFYFDRSKKDTGLKMENLKFNSPNGKFFISKYSDKTIIENVTLNATDAKNKSFDATKYPSF